MDPRHPRHLRLRPVRTSIRNLPRTSSRLSARQKHLSSKYFYDDEGSRLFQEIMKLPEYYLQRAANYEIFSKADGRDPSLVCKW